MLSNLESLKTELGAVKRIIEDWEACSQDERPLREYAVFVTARGVYLDIKRVYVASTLAVDNPVPDVPDNAASEWYYCQSKVMLEKLCEAPLAGLKNHFQ